MAPPPSRRKMHKSHRGLQRVFSTYSCTIYWAFVRTRYATRITPSITVCVLMQVLLIIIDPSGGSPPTVSNCMEGERYTPSRTKADAQSTGFSIYTFPQQHRSPPLTPEDPPACFSCACTTTLLHSMDTPVCEDGRITELVIWTPAAVSIRIPSGHVPLADLLARLHSVRPMYTASVFQLNLRIGE